MNNLEVNKSNYVREDNFHMLQVAKLLKVFAYSINNNSIQSLKERGKSYKLEHHNSANYKNVYWYGAKIYIMGPLDSNKILGKRNVFTRTPELVSGMFVKLADAFHYTDEDYFYPRLYIYEMAADFIQYYEISRNKELDVNLIKGFFIFISDYLTNYIDDDGTKIEYTRWFDESNFSIEFDYVGKNKTDQLYFAYGSNMDKIQMDFRTPGAVPLAISKKLNYRTILNTRGVATMIPEKGAISYGILWKVSDENVKTLDHYEGVKYGTYKKVNSTVMIDGYQYPSLVYVAKDDQVGMPRRFEYLDTLLRGIEYFGGHSEWYNEIKKLGYK